MEPLEVWTDLPDGPPFEWGEVQPARFPVRVERLGVAAPGSHVRFSYPSPHTRSTVFASGTLQAIERPVPVDGGEPQPVIVYVDGLRYHVPAGTLVDIETKELR